MVAGVSHEGAARAAKNWGRLETPSGLRLLGAERTGQSGGPGERHHGAPLGGSRITNRSCFPLDVSVRLPTETVPMNMPATWL